MVKRVAETDNTLWRTYTSFPLTSGEHWQLRQKWVKLGQRKGFKTKYPQHKLSSILRGDGCCSQDFTRRSVRSVTTRAYQRWRALQIEGVRIQHGRWENVTSERKIDNLVPQINLFVQHSAPTDGSKPDAVFLFVTKPRVSFRTKVLLSVRQ